MTTVRVLAFGGSLRRASLNQKLVQIAADGARAEGAEVTVVALRDHPMPLYDQEIEDAEGLPEHAARLKSLFLEHDALLLASPEYNSSVSGALKNAIDWVSRREGDEPGLAAFNGKVAGIMAASPGALGGLRGLVTLRSILSNINVLVVPQQKAIPRAHEAFDDDGDLRDEQTREAVRDIGRVVARTAARLRD